jgi:hypothetical protein
LVPFLSTLSVRLIQSSLKALDFSPPEGREGVVGGAELAGSAGASNVGLGHETEVHGLQRLTAAFED